MTKARNVTTNVKTFLNRNNVGARKNHSLHSTNNNIKQHTNTKQTFQTHMIMKMRENDFSTSNNKSQRHEAKLAMPNGIDKKRHEAKRQDNIVLAHETN